MTSSRLFVALDLSAEAIATLEQLQPRKCAGLKLVKLDQLHLTLHFLGQADVDSTTSSLQSVSASPFSLTLLGVGQFQTRDGGVLWAGIAPSAVALAPTGYKPEARPYSPHITLARYQPQLEPSVIQNFLIQHADFRLAHQAMTEFHLYSSTLTPSGPVYQRVQTFELPQPSP